MDLTVFTDGGSSHNPGKSACAFVIYNKNGSVLMERSVYLGVGSNNVAEYMGLISALREVIKMGLKIKINSLTCYSDSLLMVKQLAGEYKVKHADMKRLFMEVKLLEGQLGIIPLYRHIMREKNTRADSLVKEAIERAITPGS